MDYQEAVERGATLLDESRSGWVNEINTKSLKMSDGCYCILGQLYQSYVNGLRSLAITGGAPWGFNINISPKMSWLRQSNNLQSAWLVEIEKRRTPLTQPQNKEITG